MLTMPPGGECDKDKLCRGKPKGSVWLRVDSADIAICLCTAALFCGSEQKTINTSKHITIRPLTMPCQQCRLVGSVTKTSSAQRRHVCFTKPKLCNAKRQCLVTCRVSRKQILPFGLSRHLCSVDLSKENNTYIRA